MLSFCSAKSFSRVRPKATLLEGAFEFKDKAQVDAIFAKYPPDRKRAAIIPLLHLGQEQNGGFINRGVITAISKLTGSPFGRVHETATFYSMFRFKPPRKHTLERCNGLSCHITRSKAIKAAIERACKGTFKDGGSKDGQFDLEEVECLGACANAPVIILDGVYYQNLDEAKIEEIIKRVREGKDATELSAVKTRPPIPATIH
ncbi:Respiratory-chain NADH dehydrogenase 24 Kd subunit family protein [Tritrichomonas foetus]|uniref:Respiratory-chain NADH dehydrogenase 24 Kd subunit family protein n=1 Tax=Tritrichomonas foetus TaxID=1144522 RepID=A0A1J4KBI5_9EUKA|nr:Respiratory-chain NADH dehydrogenase 24 Kd subunit family protein [Tritrichomonas foetus]|eukprot:OHT08264.1 Respiratory-chain NADH dehydrogenase 24 Kd subunit family protein [Tritrichomonas foetus]